MAFVKKDWKDRIAEFINRRRLTYEDDRTELVEVARDEGTVSQEGDAFTAETMNDLEERIAEGIKGVEDDIKALNNTDAIKLGAVYFYKKADNSIANIEFDLNSIINKLANCLPINGNAASSSFPVGFDGRTSRGAAMSWGNTTGEFVTGWTVGENASDIVFLKDNPEIGRLSVKIDGTFYQNEGAHACLDEESYKNLITELCKQLTIRTEHRTPLLLIGGESQGETSVMYTTINNSSNWVVGANVGGALDSFGFWDDTNGSLVARINKDGSIDTLKGRVITTNMITVSGNEIILEWL